MPGTLGSCYPALMLTRMVEEQAAAPEVSSVFSSYPRSAEPSSGYRAFSARSVSSRISTEAIRGIRPGTEVRAINSDAHHINSITADRDVD